MRRIATAPPGIFHADDAVEVYMNSEQSLCQSRRKFFENVAGTGAASLITARALVASSPQADRLNIVYIHSHDSGRYLQPYGCGVPTPNLQRLAADGVLFR